MIPFFVNLVVLVQHINLVFFCSQAIHINSESYSSCRNHQSANKDLTTSIFSNCSQHLKMKFTLSSEPSSDFTMTRSLTAVITGLPFASLRNSACRPIGATIARMSHSSISLDSSLAD